MFWVKQDKRLQFAFGVALLEWLLVGGLAVLSEGGQGWLMGVVLGVATWLQLTALFWRPRPTGLFPEAQAAFMGGDYALAATYLETLRQTDPTHLPAQTLLGNTYRQLGRLTDSETVLRQAIAQKPADQFPLYGLGRTLLAQGDYQAAAECINQALVHGGRKAIRAELALAYYLGDNKEAASQAAQQVARVLGIEVYRVIMVNYLLYQLQNDPQALPLIRRTPDGLAYWQAEAQRFASTPYGQALAKIVADMQQIIEKDR